MKFFDELGLAIFDQWKRTDFDEATFPEIATAAMRERPPSRHVDPLDVVRWVHETPRLVPQMDLQSKFGDPPICVFRAERFYIEVLYWVDGTTTIHQHGFSGAFHVMAGSSLHSEYRFARERRYNQHLATGTLDLQSVELLTTGEARPIRSGPGFIHSLFHLDRPSVSVVVRTHSDSLAGPQYNYSRCGLAVDPFLQTEAIVRKTQTLALLKKMGHSDYEPLAREAVRRGDSITAYSVLTQLMTLEPSERYLAILSDVRPDHPELVDRLVRLEEERRRENNIVLRRARIQGSEHRFFLALLLNVPDRRRAIEVVRRAFPDRSPIDTMVAWATELAQIKIGDGEPSVLGVHLDETSIRIFRHMLEGATDEWVIARLKEEFSPADVDAQIDDIKAMNAAFRGSLLFGPLLAS